MENLFKSLFSQAYSSKNWHIILIGIIMIALPQIISPSLAPLVSIQSPTKLAPPPNHPTILEEFDIIREVLKFLKANDLLKLRSVNHLWNRICSELIFQRFELNRQFICYQNINFNENILNKGNKKLSTFLKYKYYVKDIAIDGPITKEKWENIRLFRNCKKLKLLRCSNIEEIDFNRINLNDHFNLSALDIEYCQYHFSMPLPLSSPQLFQVSGLTSLTLSRIPSGMQDQVLDLIMNNLHLKILRIKLHRLEIETMAVICSKMTQLQTFSFIPFKNSQLLTPSDEDKVQEFGHWCNCPNTIHFNSFNFYKYTFNNDWAPYLAELFQLNTSLKELELSDVYLDSWSLAQLGKLKELKSLRLSNCKVDTDKLIQTFQSFCSLEHCELSMVEGIDDSVVESLMQNNTKLNNLKLEWVKVTHFGVEFIRKFGSSLKYLELNLRCEFYLKQFEFYWECAPQLKTLLLENIHACSPNQIGTKQFMNLQVLYLRCKENNNNLKSKLSEELPNTKVY